MDWPRVVEATLASFASIAALSISIRYGRDAFAGGIRRAIHDVIKPPRNIDRLLPLHVTLIGFVFSWFAGSVTVEVLSRWGQAITWRIIHAPMGLLACLALGAVWRFIRSKGPRVYQYDSRGLVEKTDLVTKSLVDVAVQDEMRRQGDGDS